MEDRDQRLRRKVVKFNRPWREQWPYLDLLDLFGIVLLVSAIMFVIFWHNR